MASRVLLSKGTMRGDAYAPIVPCVARRNSSGKGRFPLLMTIALDVEVIEEQADDEAEDGPSSADRSWW